MAPPIANSARWWNASTRMFPNTLATVLACLCAVSADLSFMGPPFLWFLTVQRTLRYNRSEHSGRRPLTLASADLSLGTVHPFVESTSGSTLPEVSQADSPASARKAR